ncbi:MAG TPA: hypothetical protein VMG55_16240 [Stellaceae bacterium]|nr:hypothetical protein [Stellaceae bacterium]
MTSHRGTGAISRRAPIGGAAAGLLPLRALAAEELMEAPVFSRDYPPSKYLE